MKIIDGVVAEGYAEHLEGLLTRSRLNWNYEPATAYGINVDDVEIKEGIVDHGQWTFNVFEEGQVRDNTIFNAVLPILYNLAESEGFGAQGLHRVRLNCLTIDRAFKDTEYNQPHQDVQIPGFKTIVYYINDTQGDTVVFDGTEIVERCSPKRNRACIIDSDKFHASSNPNERSVRYVVSFLVETKGEDNVLSDGLV